MSSDDEDCDLLIDFGVDEQKRRPSWQGMVRGGKSRAAAASSLGAAVGGGDSMAAARVAAASVTARFFGVESSGASVDGNGRRAGSQAGTNRGLPTEGVDPEERIRLQRQIGNVAMGNVERAELSKM